MVPPPWRRHLQQLANMLVDKSILSKLEKNIFITIYQLFKGTMHCRCSMPMFAGCASCLWLIFANKMLRLPITVPLTVISAWWNRGGQ
jgi:hypothetical protein